MTDEKFELIPKKRPGKAKAKPKLVENVQPVDSAPKIIEKNPINETIAKTTTFVVDLENEFVFSSNDSINIMDTEVKFIKEQTESLSPSTSTKTEKPSEPLDAVASTVDIPNVMTLSQTNATVSVFIPVEKITELTKLKAEGENHLIYLNGECAGQIDVFGMIAINPGFEAVYENDGITIQRFNP